MQFLLVASALLVVLAPGLANSQSHAYTVKDLGTLPGESFATPFGLNSHGDVVGWSGFYRAFIYKDGSGMTELPAPAGRTSALARAISDGGLVVGEAWASGVPSHAIRWSGGVAQDIGKFDESSKAWEINASGVVVGDSPVDALTTAGFVFTDGGGAVVMEPSRTTSHAYDVSDAGQITGTMTVGSVYHAFRFTPGSGNLDIGALPGLPGSHGKAINVSGQVAGTLYSADGNTERIFRFTDGIGVVNLGGVGSHNDPWAVNSRGDVVGNGRPTAGLERAFIYTDQGGLQDLNLLIDPALGLLLRYAYDINDAGQIVCFASSSIDGSWHALRLSPTAPAGTLAALSISPVVIVAGNTGTGWVSITNPAPAGGLNLSLASSNPQIVSIPASLVIAEGARHASFAMQVRPVASAVSVQVSASYAGETRSASLAIQPGTTTHVGGATPPVARALRVAPNPSSGSSRFEYELVRNSKVDVGVYDVTGRLVRTLVNAALAARSQPYTVEWDGRDSAGVSMPSGVYWVRIQAGSFRDSAKLVIVR
jgi:probable HAF family extracellular repeat protein